jgi:CO/xanthine dehydrogenase FAD-binding subunit
MKPPAFDYVRPRSLDEAVETLARHRHDAKILAGGQSLVPLLNFRMLRPALLIDINRLPELDTVTEQEDGSIRIGALTRHFALETSRPIARRLPILPCAMTHVAHLAIRNRGTIGGSLSHADPAAELPMLALLLDAEISMRRAGGTRVVAAGDFFVGALVTALEDDEIVTEIAFPSISPAAGWGFEEFAQRSGDFAICAVGAVIDIRDGRIAEARIALMGVDATPVRARQAEQILADQRPDRALIKAAAASARAAVNPSTDLRASADYRRHLVEALGEQVLCTACRRAEGRLS